MLRTFEMWGCLLKRFNFSFKNMWFYTWKKLHFCTFVRYGIGGRGLRALANMPLRFFFWTAPLPFWQIDRHIGGQILLLTLCLWYHTPEEGKFMRKVYREDLYYVRPADMVLMGYKENDKIKKIVIFMFCMINLMPFIRTPTIRMIEKSR